MTERTTLSRASVSTPTRQTRSAASAFVAEIAARTAQTRAARLISISPYCWSSLSFPARNVRVGSMRRTLTAQNRSDIPHGAINLFCKNLLEYLQGGPLRNVIDWDGLLKASRRPPGGARHRQVRGSKPPAYGQRQICLSAIPFPFPM